MAEPASIRELTEFILTEKASTHRENIPLFIVEPEVGELDQTFWKTVEPSLSYILLDSPYAAESLTDALAKAQQENRAVLIDIRADPHPHVIDLLKAVSFDGVLRGPGSAGTVSVPVVAPIWAVIRHELLHGGVSYRGFASLFGASFSIY